jgi:hypothetical protein
MEILFVEVGLCTNFLSLNIMPKNKRRRHGVAAKIIVYKKSIHFRAAISKRYPNATKNDVLSNLLVIGQEENIASKRQQVYFTMVKSFMLLLNFARSPKKDRSNPCLILYKQTMWKTTRTWLLGVMRT